MLEDTSVESFRVLLVDDEEEFLDVLAERLETRGMTVVTATDGVQALEKAEGRVFDAVVLDMAMPGMDGIETLQGLRAVHPDIQVILLTGQATPSQAAMAIKLGALDLMEKPAEIDSLIARIEEASDTRHKLEDKRIQDRIEDIMRKKSW